MENVSQEKQAKETQSETKKEMEEKKEFPIETEVSPLIPETKSMIERAEAVAKTVQERIEKLEQLTARNEAIVARMMLSGRAEAGQQFKTAEQTEKEEIERQSAEIVKRFSSHR